MPSQVYRLGFVDEWINSTTMVRAFVALELSAEIKGELRRAQESLRDSGIHLAFVRPELIHITAKFLGDVDEKTLPLVIAALKSIRSEPFTVSVNPITADNASRPRSVWCLIGDAGESERLFRNVEDLLAPLGFPRETRKFTPHATIARMKRPEPGLLPALAKIRKNTYGTSPIFGMSLKKSTLTPQGPIYEDILGVTW
jgi:2'-5' RNA ligase